MDTASNSPAWRAVAAAGFIALLGVVATTSADPLASTAHVAALGAAAVFVLAAAGHRGARARGWVPVGAGLACWMLAAVLATFEATGNGVPAMSIGVVYSLGSLPMMVGLASLGAPLDAERHLAAMLDWALLFTLAFGVMWRLAVEPVALDATLSLTDRTLASLVPAADLALVMLATRLVCHKAVPAATGWLTTCGFMLVTAGHLVHLARYGTAGATSPGTAWAQLVGVSMVAAAAMHDHVASRPRRLPPHTTDMAPPWMSALVASVASIPPIALILADVHGERSVHLTPVVTWLVVVVVLATWRGLAAHQARRRAVERSEWLASHDVVTGAYRTHSFLELAGARSARDRVGTVLALDLGGLQAARDEHGDDVADTALAELASRARAALSDGALLARTGDHQLVAFVRSSDLHRGRVMAEAMRSALHAPVQVNEVELVVTVSVGVAQTDGTVIDVEAGMRRATAAVQHVLTVDPGGIAIDAELAGAL